MECVQNEAYLQYVAEQDADDINDVEIRWDKEHNFYELHNEYEDELDAEIISKMYEEVMNSNRVINRRTVCRTMLNLKQGMSHDLIIRALNLQVGQSKTDGGDDVSRLQLIIGKGGAGKSYVLDSVISTFKREYAYDDENYLIMAPTGKAASNVSGSTIHSHKEGLGLPVKGKLRELNGEKLNYFQRKYKYLKLVIMDEFTMISQTLLYRVDKRLRQITTVNKPFGGLVVILIGDPGQLPPVGQNSLWIDICKEPEDIYGYALYNQFDDVIILEENNRLDRSDPDAVLFDEFLNRLRNRENTTEDWNLLRKKCSYCSIGHAGWVNKGFEEDNVIHLFTNNREVEQHNNMKIKKVGNPIALIESENTGRARTMKEDNFGGLKANMYLCVGANVVLTRNFLNIGLSNGSTGIAREKVYDKNKPAPGLPRFVFVDFGKAYTGPTFFPNDASRRGWFPIHPVTSRSWTPGSGQNTGYVEHTRTMLPLKLCWAWTVWKSQGMTIDNKVVVSLTKREIEHGLTYVALSRATKFTNIGIKDTEGLSKNRLCKQIRNHKKMSKRLQEEERLRALEKETLKYFN